jgi:PAS domain-containing protein
MTLWRGVDLDRLTLTDLEGSSHAVVALDDEGRIVAMSQSAARWFGVTAWQARGRALVRELGWRLGAATEAIAGFLGSPARFASVRVPPHRATARRPSGPRLRWRSCAATGRWYVALEP